MSENGPRRLLAAVLIRAVRDALAANSDLAAEVRGWLGVVGSDLVTLLDVPPERLTTWFATLPSLPVERLAPHETRRVA
ncbi:MAG: hypothetical protein FJ011_26785 [Chloroflexi bacterium]|nr:hypothetical protein [Chloroflexota bacterium]